MRRGALLLAIAVVVGGCGNSDSQRKAVAAYLNKVQAIQNQLATPLTKVTQVGSQFANQVKVATGGTAGQLAHRQTLLTAASQIDGLGAKLAAVSTPSPAQHLRSLSLQLVQQESAMTRELSKMVVFLPAFESVMRPLGPATSALQRVLAVSQPRGYGPSGVAATLSVKAQALRRYAADLEVVVGELRRLDPPAVSTPQYATQITTLTRMRSAAGKVATALDRGSSNVGPLLLDFDKAAAAAQSEPAQRAQITAIRSYDDRVRSLTKDVQMIELERARLQRTLK
jgi:hypothetical protein